MGRFLNVGVIQMPVSLDTAKNLAYIEQKVGMLMSGAHRPEQILGVECIATMTPEPIPGDLTAFFGGLAKNTACISFPVRSARAARSCPQGNITTRRRFLIPRAS